MQCMTETYPELSESLENLVANRGNRLGPHEVNMHNRINNSDFADMSRNAIVTGTTAIIVDQDALQQGLSEHGKLSAVRRFFCLFATFDLFLMLLLWLICTVASGLTIKQAFRDDVMHYNINTSMFDVFLISLTRFTCLLLAYALLRLNHWWVVALTTAGSCAFLIAKVFLYNFTAEWTRVYTFNILLMVTSFVIAWTEAWFYDCRVLPTEKKAYQILNDFEGPTERSSLLRRYLENCEGAPSETVGTFYSAFPSPTGSECGFRHIDEVDRASLRSYTLEENELIYRTKGKYTLETVWRLMQSDGWKLAKESDCGDTVESKQSDGRNIFLLTAEIEINPDVLFKELFYKIEESPKWNPTILYSKVIQKIDNHTDISYNVAAEGAGGLVAARDFVSLRYWEYRDGVYISSGISISHPDMPPQKKYTRGENGPGAWVIRKCGESPQKCQFQWLLNTDLKGWVPQYLCDQALSGVLLDYIGYVRNHAARLSLEQQP